MSNTLGTPIPNRSDFATQNDYFDEVLNTETFDQLPHCYQHDFDEYTKFIAPETPSSSRAPTASYQAQQQHRGTPRSIHKQPLRSDLSDYSYLPSNAQDVDSNLLNRKAVQLQPEFEAWEAEQKKQLRQQNAQKYQQQQQQQQQQPLYLGNQHQQNAGDSAGPSMALRGRINELPPTNPFYRASLSQVSQDPDPHPGPTSASMPGRYPPSHAAPQSNQRRGAPTTPAHGNSPETARCNEDPHIKIRTLVAKLDQLKGQYHYFMKQADDAMEDCHQVSVELQLEYLRVSSVDEDVENEDEDDDVGADTEVPAAGSGLNQRRKKDRKRGKGGGGQLKSIW